MNLHQHSTLIGLVIAGLAIIVVFIFMRRAARLVKLLISLAIIALAVFSANRLFG